MKKMDKEQLKNGLLELGITKGDTVLVHSNIASLGVWDGTREEILKAHYDAFMEILGESGTLCVPAYFYEYAREGIPFDTKNTPVSKELGIFSQYVTSLENSMRSINPLTAISCIGFKAKWLVGGNNGISYGYDTVWDRLTKADGKMVFLGIDLRAMTYVHHVECCCVVPHVYNKRFTTPVFCGGVPLNIPICSQVRYLDFDISYSSDKLTEMFKDITKETIINRGTVRVLSFQDAFAFLSEKLKIDPFYLLTKEPAFIKGKIPLDGIATS